MRHESSPPPAPRGILALACRDTTVLTPQVTASRSRLYCDCSMLHGFAATLLLNQGSNSHSGDFSGCNPLARRQPAGYFQRRATLKPWQDCAEKDEPRC